MSHNGDQLKTDGASARFTQHRSVALLIETSSKYARGLLEGVIDYVNRHRSWSIALPDQERGASPADWLARWTGDGIIARIETAEMATAVRQTNRPAVDVSAARQLPGIPMVDTDDRAVAELAAEHLLQRGFQNLAYCGDPGFTWSRWREKYFDEAASSAGCEMFIHQSLPVAECDYSWIRERSRLAEWISQLPLPCGIMVSHDVKALQLLDVCCELNISVPEQIAVVGVDNDHLLCDLANPSLTSIIPDTHRSGYEAAKILDRLMSGEQHSSDVHLIPPLGIQARKTTDTLAITNPEIAQAVRFIRENATTGIDVSDILKEVPLSRAMLESQFRRTVHSSPHQEIMRIRIERVKELLAATPLTLAEIARRTGFNRVEYLSVAFRREVGQTPSEFRRKHAASFRKSAVNGERPSTATTTGGAKRER